MGRVSHVPSPAETDGFWTSPIVATISVFLMVALVKSDPLILLPALLVFLGKACFLIAKWVAFIAGGKDLQEAIKISKGYLLLVWSHIAVFLDSNDGGGHGLDRYRKKLTAGVVLHFHQIQLYVLTRYLHRRQENLRAVTRHLNRARHP